MFCNIFSSWCDLPKQCNEKTPSRESVISWLTLADTLRTASIDFDNEKLRIIKEILV